MKKFQILFEQNIASIKVLKVLRPWELDKIL